MSTLSKALAAAAALAGLGLFAASRNAGAAEPDPDVGDEPGPPDDSDEPEPPISPDPIADPPEPIADPPEPLDPFGDLPPPPDPVTPRKPKHIGTHGGGDEEPVDDGPARKPKHIGTHGGGDEGPPWAEIFATYPRGARFLQVLPDERFGGTNGTYSIAYRYLLSEAYLAAKEFGGLDDDEARVWARAVAKQDKLRARMIDEIQCAGWNDAAYGQAPKNGTRTSKHGRAIPLLPMHAPNAALLAAGEQPFRNVTKTGGLGNPAYRHLECLWLPPISRRRLWDDELIVTDSEDLVWADGSSQQNPPPWVMSLGMGDQSGDLHGDFGCPGTEGELEIE